MSDDAALSVTIKNGGGYDETWAVFRGTLHNVRLDLIEYYGLTVDEEQTLHEVALMATEVAHGTGTVARELGGTVVKPSEGKGKPAQRKQEQKPDNSALITACETASSVDDLKALWARNKEVFSSDDAVKAAYSKRGKELMEAKKDG